jgi:hypothetical protein
MILKETGCDGGRLMAITGDRIKFWDLVLSCAELSDYTTTEFVKTLIKSNLAN